ncbi:hypothetical protein [Vulgatibacter incomptus]|uniref:Phosphate-selective porin O and P n=1 Tax=Vulgatibacter incomptus TaxID=1391653 RepID=A0A0K1P8R5_9BACT|nr:hypothetical protein [Vulgatibacter incomptus]AKU89915.1 hypothetical protein AKJ08_0302 [Vulgatibacter incomptus]
MGLRELSVIVACALLAAAAPARAAEVDEAEQAPDDAEESTRPEVPFPPTPPEVPAKPNLLMESQRLEISGVIFAFWSVDLTAAPPGASTRGGNRFELTRSYLNVDAQITRSINTRISPDIVRVSGTTSNIEGTLDLVLAYSFVRFLEVAPGLDVIAGLQSEPITAFDDSVWRYRVLGPSVFNFEDGLPVSDLGVGATSTLLDGRLQAHFLLANGAGGSSTEGTKFKEGSGRITYTPFASSPGAWGRQLRATALGTYGVPAVADDRRLSRAFAGGLLSFEPDLGTLAVGGGPTWNSVDLRDQGLGIVDRHGVLFTAYGFLNLPLRIRLLARFDLFDPDVEHSARTSPLNQTTGRTTRTIGGVAHLFNEQVQVVLDYQRFGLEVPERAAAGTAESVLFVHLEARF